MKSERNYEFRKELLEVHKADIRDFQVKCKDNQLELSDGCVIVIPENSNDVIQTAARDLVDFLFVSMNVSARISKNQNEIGEIILKDEKIDLEEADGYKGYKIAVNEKIVIHAFDDRGSQQAFYRLEEMMSFAKGPFIEKGIIKCRPLFSPQMVHSAFGLDMYPDNYLSLIAHAGRDAILVFVKNVNITPSGYLDFNDLIYRAAKFGIDVYAYSYMKCEKHPDDYDSKGYYEASYGKLFRECPGLKGIVMVGESLAFPSKDEYICNPQSPNGVRPVAGWWPCSDYSQLLCTIRDTVRKYNSVADIVFWTYNWGFAPENLRVNLIKSLPKDISLLVTFEMFEEFPCGDSTQYCSDYTLSQVGPGKCFISEAIAAKEQGIKLYTMCNTGGKTWDFGTVPYLPMPYQWIKRFEKLKEAQENWGLCGLMESHHYGMTPSCISELSKWIFSTERISPEIILDRMIDRDYGSENTETVKDIFKLWSKAITYYTPSIEDQYGPFRIGPSYPLCLERAANVPEAEYAHFGMSICETLYAPKNFRHSSFSSLRMSEEIASLENMYEYMHAGVELLAKLTEKTEKAERLLQLGSYIMTTVRTGINVKKWYINKTKLFNETNRDNLIKILDTLVDIANEEIKNAKSILWATDCNSYLGFEPSMEYLGDSEHILWKINQVEKMRDLRLAEFRDCILK